MIKKLNNVNLFTTWTEILLRLSESFMDSGTLILKIMSLFIRAEFHLHNFTPGQQEFYWGSLRLKLLGSKYSPGLCSASRCVKKQSNRGNKETLWLKKRWSERKGISLWQKKKWMLTLFRHAFWKLLNKSTCIYKENDIPDLQWNSWQLRLPKLFFWK